MHTFFQVVQNKLHARHVVYLTFSIIILCYLFSVRLQAAYAPQSTFPETGRLFLLLREGVCGAGLFELPTVVPV